MESRWNAGLPSPEASDRSVRELCHVGSRCFFDLRRMSRQPWYHIAPPRRETVMTDLAVLRACKVDDIYPFALGIVDRTCMEVAVWPSINLGGQ